MSSQHCKGTACLNAGCACRKPAPVNQPRSLRKLMAGLPPLKEEHTPVWPDSPRPRRRVLRYVILAAVIALAIAGIASGRLELALAVWWSV